MRGIKQRLSSPLALFSQLLFFYLVSFVIGYFWYLKTSSKAYILYIFLAEILTIARPRVRELGKLVRTQMIDPFLVKPSPLFFQFLPYYFGIFIFDFAFLFVSSFPIFLILGFPSPFFFLLAPFSFLLMYCVSFLLQLFSFFFGETRFLNWILDKLIFIAGGTAIPLNLFPFPLISLLPFKYMIYAPVAFSIGFSSDIFPIFLWLALLLPLISLFEKIAVMHYAVGG